MTRTHANRIGFGWIVAAVAVLSLTAAGPMAVYAKSGHHGGGHHSGGHRSGVQHSGGHRSGVHHSGGHHGGRHGLRLSFGLHGYGYGYGSRYLYSDSYYRYPPIRNRYGTGYGYGGYPSYSYPSRSRATVYYGGSYDSAPKPYGEYSQQASVNTTPGATAYDRDASVGTRGWAMLADGRHYDA